MEMIRVALANLRYPATPAESVELARRAVEQAAVGKAVIVCFPECYVPGYRAEGKTVPPADPAFLEAAWSAIAASARQSKVAAVLGTERVVNSRLLPTALVIGADGSRLGFQDKVQLDPSEEAVYSAGRGRQVFRVGLFTLGVVICHEGWRYPETVRWAARQGAQIVFHPQFDEYEPGNYVPTTYADPSNTFHEKAVLCRAAENNCYFATVNYASPGSATTSAVARPDGSLAVYQPYGQEGLLFADIDLSAATGLVAKRLKPV